MKEKKKTIVNKRIQQTFSKRDTFKECVLLEYWYRGAVGEILPRKATVSSGGSH